jgi:hypothetical protein
LVGFSDRINNLNVAQKEEDRSCRIIQKTEVTGVAGVTE